MGEEPRKPRIGADEWVASVEGRREGYAGLVIPRSGLALEHGISLVNTPGLIDSGYRGELRVIALNTDRERPFTVEVGMRIAQLVVTPAPEVDVVVLDELPETVRGGAGFGSSGA